MSDLISRQAAIDLFPNDVLEWDTLDGYIAPHVARQLIEDLPSAQQEPEEFEWCHDCKEYDQTAHCCHRWTKVIRQTVAEIKAEQQWHTGEPSESGDYLCYKYVDDDDFGYFYVDTYYTHNGTVEYGTPLAYKGWQDSHDRVVAWMPLPKPYEAEE